MILEHIPADTTPYRTHAPEYARQPTSGTGKALKGGRFNREGVEALYLALNEVTALREVPTDLPVPAAVQCTMCSYTTTLAKLVDLRQLTRAPCGTHTGRKIGSTSSSIFTSASDMGANDLMLVPSTANPGGVNIVMFTERLGGQCVSAWNIAPSGGVTGVKF